jgi:hypothetical protein
LINYDDTSGAHDLSVAGDWWVITASNDPNTKTGVAQLPGFYDEGYIRTGRNDLFLNNATLNAKFLGIGGKALAANPPTTTTVVTVGSGGTIETRSATGTSTSDNLWIGYNYDATLTVNGGTVKAMDTTGTFGSWIGLGGKTTTKVGTLNVQSGLVQFGALNAAWNNGVAIINHSGGTMKHIAQNGGGDRIYLGYANDGSFTGRCEYNLSGTGYLDITSVQIKMGNSGGEGLFNMTGGSINSQYSGTTLVMGTTATSVTEFRLLGGKMNLAGRIGTAGISKFVVNQAGAMELGWNWTTTSNTDSVELLVNSANDFQLKTGWEVNWFSTTQVAAVLTDSYTPTVGQTWKFVDCGAGTIVLPVDGWHPDGSRFDFYTYRDGQGAGWALYKDTVNNDVRLEYVPEPATLSVLVLGGLALLRRKRTVVS